MKPVHSLLKLFLGLSFLITLTSCVATPKQPSTGEYIDDSIVTARVKTAIFAEPTLKTLQISVITYRGVVQLSGFVDARENVRMAEAVAEAVPGVRKVVNDLLVK